MFFVQEEKLRGVSVWNVREAGGQESHFGACICPLQRKLASQLGEVLFVCQFYDLQIVKKTSLSLRNLWLHLVQMCVCPSSPQSHYNFFTYYTYFL